MPKRRVRWIINLTMKDFVIALGGSSLHLDHINVEYLKRFFDFIKERIGLGERFVIIVGGGGLARKFQKAAGEIVEVSDEDKDWLGIHTTRLNAHLLRTIFYKEAHPVIMDSRGKLKDFDGHPLIIAAGWRPGWSTDFVAVQIAVDFGLGQTIILGKPDYVYDKDNQKFSDAKPIKEISWDDYSKLIPKDWSPGIHAPVDPVAAKLAKDKNMEVIVASGYDLENVKNVLEGKEFLGTTIKK